MGGFLNKFQKKHSVPPYYQYYQEMMQQHQNQYQKILQTEQEEKVALKIENALNQNEPKATDFKLCNQAKKTLNIIRTSADGPNSTVSQNGMQLLLRRRAEKASGIKDAKERKNAILDIFDLQQQLYQEMIKQLQTEQEEKVALKIENNKLRKDVSIVLARTIIDKLGRKYGEVFNEPHRRVRWFKMLENSKVNKPISLISKKIAEAKLTNKDFVKMVLDVCDYTDDQIHDKIIVRNFKMRWAFHNDAPERIMWFATTLREAYELARDEDSDIDSD